MLPRIIRIAAPVAAALALLLEGGCYRTDELKPETGEIGFEAGSYLLRDDATTKATTDSFTSSDDTFVVFGEKVTASDVHTVVFNGVTVQHQYETEDDEVVKDEWGYTPLRFWSWTSQSDRYDFVAVSPAEKGTVKEETADSHLAVSTHYDYSSDKYDILAATYRRSGSDWDRRHDEVPLTFSHMGSAVAVTVINSSSSTNVAVTAIYYENLVVSADAKVSQDNYGRSVLRWANLTPSAAPVRRLGKTPATTIAPQDEYTGEYQIMIPQNLTLYGAQLYLKYKVGNSVEEITSPPIALASIERDDGTPITSWEIGYKYTYIVSMRLDGGLLVRVTTTPWDEPVQGETPGILI